MSKLYPLNLVIVIFFIAKMYQKLPRLAVALNLAASAPFRLAAGSSQRRRFSSGNVSLSKSPRLGQTSVFFQTGLKICELPLVVKKVEDVLRIGETTENGKSSHLGGLVTLTYPQEMDAEASEIVAGFNRCFTASAIFRLLETIPAEEVTPLVAVHALNRIIDFEKASRQQKSTFMPGFDRDTDANG